MMATRDPRQIVTFSFCVLALVCYMRAGFTPQVDFNTLLIPTVIQGAALAAFFVPLTSISLSGLEPHRIATAAGLTNFFRLTAGAFGTSIATTAWENRASLHHARLTEIATPSSPAYAQIMGLFERLNMSSQQALTALNNLINSQALTMSVTDIFYGSTLIFLALIGLVWFARPVYTTSANATVTAAH
jgi:DHA2 family multidrug resistance protein